MNKALRAAVDQQIVGAITTVRARNNDLWMRLLAIAIEAAPDKTKAVLREINENDREISGLLGELAK
jgi:hypothetical protein